MPFPRIAENEQSATPPTNEKRALVRAAPDRTDSVYPILSTQRQAMSQVHLTCRFPTGSLLVRN